VISYDGSSLKTFKEILITMLSKKVNDVLPLEIQNILNMHIGC